MQLGVRASERSGIRKRASQRAGGPSVRDRREGESRGRGSLRDARARPSVRIARGVAPIFDTAVAARVIVRADEAVPKLATLIAAGSSIHNR